MSRQTPCVLVVEDEGAQREVLQYNLEAEGFDVVVADNFTGDGSSIDMLEMVIGGWNGFVDPSSITAYEVNFYSSPDAAGGNLMGDVDSNTIDAADATQDPNWTGANYLMGFSTSKMCYIQGPNLSALDFVLPSDQTTWYVLGYSNSSNNR